MDHAAHLKTEIEAAASALGLAPSTVGERAGQGGKFYARLCEGKRVWPETAEAVRLKIQQMLSPSGDAPIAGAGAEGSLPAHKGEDGDGTRQGNENHTRGAA